jgi:two-component sensor histidine kinase
MENEDDIKLAKENTNLRRLLERALSEVSEHEAADKLQRIVLEELHHRVKNMLTTVQAITLQSIRSADSLEHARHAVENRLLALGRVHDLLLRTNWSGTRLAELLKVATEPFATSRNGRFLIQTADIEVDAGAALPLAMTLNELCTNAVKYGALSAPEGHVSIITEVDDAENKLRLTWAERGGPAVREPARRSFGTRLIEMSFASQLNSDTRLKFEPTGVICEIHVPLAVLRPQISN